MLSPLLARSPVYGVRYMCILLAGSPGMLLPSEHCSGSGGCREHGNMGGSEGDIFPTQQAVAKTGRLCIF